MDVGVHIAQIKQYAMKLIATIAIINHSHHMKKVNIGVVKMNVNQETFSNPVVTNMSLIAINVRIHLKER